MTNLHFTPVTARRPLTAALAKLTAMMEDDYETGGPCTHTAETNLDETVFAYPLVGGDRLLLVWRNGGEYQPLAMGDQPDECNGEWTDADLEAGISAHPEMF